MNSHDIVLLGVKFSVLAFNKTTGERLWSADLGSGLSEGFVTLLADDKQVYAHSRGKLFCLDLFSGKELWSDTLSGYGYGLASLAAPGIQPSSSPSGYAAKQQSDSRAASTGVT